MLLASLLAGCRTPEAFDTPIEPDHPWEVGEPDATWAARFDAAQAYHADNDGLAMVIVQGDLLVYEAAANGHTAATPGPLWSGTKTFACALALLGEGQGLLTLDELAADTLTDWADDSDKGTITLRHLLQFTSGLKDALWSLSVDGFYTQDQQRVDDKYAFAVDQPVETTPGSAYDYGAVHLLAFGAVLERKLGGSPLAWLEQHVLEPIGFRYSGWTHDPDGNPMWPYGAWTTAAEWARFAVLLRDDGVWEGTRLLPEGVLETCGTGSEPNPAYGLAAWINKEVSDDLDLSGIAEFEESGPLLYNDAPRDLFVAAGARGQRAYVFPSLDMVVVLLTDSRKDFVDREFLALLLGA
jgi:CubicO group peptidase (beta-lactamase class C family)